MQKEALWGNRQTKALSLRHEAGQGQMFWHRQGTAVGQNSTYMYMGILIHIWDIVS